MRTTKYLLATVCTIALATSCTPDEEKPETSPQESEAAKVDILITDLAKLGGTEWSLADLCGTPVPDDAKIDLKFLEDGRISGNASVNRYSGPLILDEGIFEFGPFLTTRMAGNPEAMERESAFLEALSAAVSIRMTDDGQLIIPVADQEHPLRFKPVDQ